MKRTTIAERLETGADVLGARTVTMSPSMVEVYGHLGLDFTWLDFEHCGGSPSDSDLLERYTRAADVADVDLLVRLPQGDPSLVRKVLDTGVRTLLVPQVERPGDIRPAIEASRFTYDGAPGTRGSGIGRDNVWTAEIPDDVDEVDSEIAVGCMIETRTAVENVEEILSVPGLGFVVIGPSDLSISYGHPFDRDHPEVRDAIDTVREACLDADVPVGGVTDDTDDARTKLDEGYRLLRVGDEVSSARTVLGERLDTLTD
ncbi:HpcH/HpaI aldolase family protein [Halorarum halophilum]|nr:aldolase/citrate lyase family protein [Halobaculum halophilum]